MPQPVSKNALTALKPKGGWRHLRGYLLACLLVSLALTSRLALDPVWGNSKPFVPFFAAIILTVWLTDWRPSVLAIGASILLADWLFIPPRYSLRFESPGEWVNPGVFLCICFALLAFAEKARHALRREQQASAALKQEQQRLCMALTSAQAATWEMDLATRTISGSPELDKLFGLESAGNRADYRDRVHPDDRPAIDQAVTAALKGHTPGYDIEFRICRSDGSLRWLHSRGEVVRHSQPLRVVGVISDITQRKGAEQALRESESRFRSLFENAPDAVLLTVPDGRILAANPAACALFGLSEQEICQAGREGLIDPEDPRHATALEERQRTGRLCDVELTFRSKAGHKFIGEVSSAIVPGSSPRAFVVIRNITQRKRAEAALQEAQERNWFFANALENCSQPFAAEYPDGRLMTFNRAFVELTGYTEKELRSTTWAVDLTPPEWREREAKVLAELAQTGHPQLYQKEYRRKDGQRVPLEIKVHLVRTPEGQPEYYYSFLTDITERKHFQAELERLVAERTTRLQEIMGELQHVSYSLVHDMRAPLRALQGFASLLDSCSALKRQEYCQRIVAATNRMDLQITDALSYTKAVLQELPLVPVDLSELLREVLVAYPNLHPEKADIHIEEALPQVLGNESLLAQCFSNLLGNAVKFVAPGTRPQVRIWAEPLGPASEERLVRVWIEDNGIGIPKPAQGRLFGMFERMSHDYEGTGMGLAIVRKVVERMAGTVGVESDTGKGSRFWVNLKAVYPR